MRSRTQDYCFCTSYNEMIPLELVKEPTKDHQYFSKTVYKSSQRGLKKKKLHQIHKDMWPSRGYNKGLMLSLRGIVTGGQRCSTASSCSGKMNKPGLIMTDTVKLGLLIGRRVPILAEDRLVSWELDGFQLV